MDAIQNQQHNIKSEWLHIYKGIFSEKEGAFFFWNKR